MKNNSVKKVTFTASHESISQRARELWQSYGRPEGRDNEIWLEAERQLLGVDPVVEINSHSSAPAAEKSASKSKASASVKKPAVASGASAEKKPAVARAKR